MPEHKRTGCELIAEERARQVTHEKYESHHDDRHTGCAMARAAAWYALPDFNRRNIKCFFPTRWKFKPTPDDRVRELVKAGALIAAEIDRIQRKEPPHA